MMYTFYSELDFMVLYMLAFYKYEEEVSITLDEVLLEFAYYNAKQASGFWYEDVMEYYLDALLDKIEYEILKSTKLGDLL